MPQTLLSLVSFALIFIVCAGAATVGGWRERVAAAGFAISVLASVAVQRLSAAWDPVVPLTGIDIALLAVFGAIAWRPRRGWPVWAVALQGLNVAVDLLRAAQLGMAPYTYITAVNLCAYGVTAVIAYAGWAAWRKRRRG